MQLSLVRFGVDKNDFYSHVYMIFQCVFSVRQARATAFPTRRNYICYQVTLGCTKSDHHEQKTIDRIVVSSIQSSSSGGHQDKKVVRKVQPSASLRPGGRAT